MSDWYYAKDGDQKGPINESELKTLLANGQLAPHSLVWKEGMANWLPANQVPNFTFRPPPIPAKSQSGAPPLPASESGVSSLSSFSVPGLPPVGEAVPMDEADVEKNKVFAILAYLGILFLVPLLAAGDSPFAKYHANQGLVLFLLSLVVFFGVVILNILLYFLGISFLGLVFNLFYVGIMVLAILGIVNAAGGKAAPLPIIGGIKLIK